MSAITAKREFPKKPCPVCGKIFAVQGLPSHQRTHNQSAGLQLVPKATVVEPESYRRGYREGFEDALALGKKVA
jgi:hypothetical protein